MHTRPKQPRGGRQGRRVAVEYRRIAELTLDPNNPRRDSRKQIRQIARSIEAFGLTCPC